MTICCSRHLMLSGNYVDYYERYCDHSDQNCFVRNVTYTLLSSHKPEICDQVISTIEQNIRNLLFKLFMSKQMV